MYEISYRKDGQLIAALRLDIDTLQHPLPYTHINLNEFKSFETLVIRYIPKILDD